MPVSDPTFVDIVVSLFVGGVLGYVTGGFWNLLQGKKFNGKAKETVK